MRVYSCAYLRVAILGPSSLNTRLNRHIGGWNAEPLGVGELCALKITVIKHYADVIMSIVTR